MQFFLTAWPTRPARASVIALGALAPLLLSGCGGGSSITNSSTTADNGFRLVPAGGMVVPLAGVTLDTKSGVVDQGVQVSVSKVATLPAPPPAGLTQVSDFAYQFAFSPSQPALNSPITLTLPGTVTSTEAIYTYHLNDSGGSGSAASGQWVALPGTILTTTLTGTTIQAYMTGSGPVPGTSFRFPEALKTFSDGQVYAVFSGMPPVPPGKLALLSLTPANATPGGASLTPTLLPATFATVSSVQFGTDVISAGLNSDSTAVTVTIPAADIATASSVPVSIPGATAGGSIVTTDALTFTVK